MYEWIPQKTNQKARNAVFLLLGGAAALIAIPVLVPALPFRWIVQLIAFGLLTVAIFLVSRYTAKSYVYRVLPREDGSRDLTVTELKGGRSRVIVCRMGLAGVERLVCDDAEHRAEARALRELARKERRSFFDYSVDLLPDRSILLLAEEGGQAFALRLSFDAELLALLTPAEPSEPKEDGEWS